jgi:hypothetical protein
LAVVIAGLVAYLAVSRIDTQQPTPEFGGSG